jgi:FkbM family methyltransferase
MNNVLGIPRKWWPQLHSQNGTITRHNLLQTTEFLFKVVKIKTRLAGARINKNSDAVGSVVLNTHSPLGRRNQVIYVEKDDVIYREIILNGSWGSEESSFLTSLLKKDSTLIDLGANVGLITRQVLNRFNSHLKVIAVEPRRQTMINLKANLQTFKNNSLYEIHYCQFAQGKTDGFTTLYTEENNIGNSSLVFNLAQSKKSEEIQIMSGKNFERRFLSTATNCVLKSDLQGYDALVLNQFDNGFWDNVIGGIIEIWPNEYQNSTDVRNLLAKISHRFIFSFSTDFKNPVAAGEIVSYWLNPTLKSQNLFFRMSS